MKATRILAAISALVAFSSVAHAQFVRLSWDNCAPQVADKMYLPPSMNPAENYLQVMSATGLSGGNVGHESLITIHPVENDTEAWRYDDAGCQTGSQLTLSSNGLNKSCPPLRGPNSLAITQYSYDPALREAYLKLTLTYDVFSASPSTRYTMWQVTYNHSFSRVGGDANPTDEFCDHVERGSFFDVFTEILLDTGSKQPLQRQPGDAPVTWNGGPAVPTNAATWSRVKGQYR